MCYNKDMKELEQLISKITHPKKKAFLENYGKCLRTYKTAQAIGVNESTVYRWFEADKVFSQVFQVLKKRIDTDRLEEIEVEIHNRALDRDAYGSSILLMFEAKALDPGKYREKPTAIPITGEITVVHKIPRPPGVDVKQLKESDGQERTDQAKGSALQE